MRYEGKTALVTGASAGLGASYARQLAALGADVVLTARREDRLAALADELRGLGRWAQVVPADLSKPDAPAGVIEACERPIDILVNNAGFGLPGTFDRTTWTEQRDFIQLMLTSCAELAHRTLPGMYERRWGRIVNVASLAGIVPGSAGHTLYGATKAFLISFSQSLAAEGTPNGVRAQACCPGFTYTEFHDVNGTRDKASTMPDFMWMKADDVIQGSLTALENGPVVFVPGRLNQAIARTTRVLGPKGAAKMMNRQASRFRRSEGSGAGSPTGST